MSWLVFCILVLLCSVFGIESNKYKIVSLDEGDVKGVKYWDGEYYEFYGVPYAKVPSGKDRFKGPLPPDPWDSILEANDDTVLCPQVYYTGDNPEDLLILGKEDCLTMNLFVPTDADEDNLLPVLVYIHSGAFSIGDGNMAKYQYLVRHDVIVISFNYRLGALGFACLNTEDIPGNAGLKDQVAALRWINKNIIKFGGDPNKVTVAGFSVGAAMAEMLTLSGTTEGLIHKLILESGSALSSWAVNINPLRTALNYAISLGYNNTGKIEDLTHWYLEEDSHLLASKSLNFFLKNGTFGFAPCIEKSQKNLDRFLTESPMDILRNRKGQRVPILTGFANMEGLSRINQFDNWVEIMEEKFSDFLPTDLEFKNEKDLNDVLKDLRNHYFNGEEISHNTIQGYVDYTSDSMFKYPILRSLKFHAEMSKKPIFVYEFCYVGNLNTKHNYIDIIKGASHRDQTSYILDFQVWTSKYEDLDIRDIMTTMWTDFVKFEDPTAYESSLIDFKWHNYSSEQQNYLRINTTLEMKKGLLSPYIFWDAIYNEYYRNPTPSEV